MIGIPREISGESTAFLCLRERKSIAGRQSIRSKAARRSRPAKNSSRRPTNFFRLRGFPLRGMHSGPLPRGLPRQDSRRLEGSRRRRRRRDRIGSLTGGANSLRLSPRSPTSSPTDIELHTYVCMQYMCIDSSNDRMREETGGEQRDRRETRRGRGATRQTSVPHACGGRRVEKTCVCVL